MLLSEASPSESRWHSREWRCGIIRDGDLRAGLTTTKRARLQLLKSRHTRKPHLAVRFAVPNTRAKFSAGQWIFICIPRLGLLHWHPFTIASSGRDEDMLLYFAGHGKWTSRVARLAQGGGDVKVWLQGHMAVVPCCLVAWLRLKTVPHCAARCCACRAHCLDSTRAVRPGRIDACNRSVRVCYVCVLCVCRRTSRDRTAPQW